MGPRCGEEKNIFPPQEFEPRTVKSVASRSTDCAIPDHRRHDYDHKYEVAKDFDGHVRGINERNPL
jgi:xanthine dehydrogenase molybdopterin-binding subunit B